MSENVILLADGAVRGDRAFQHAMWTWEEDIHPVDEHSKQGFKACMSAAKQGPAHNMYDEVINDICQWCIVEHDGMEYKIVMIEGDVWGYIPDTPEAAELLA